MELVGNGQVQVEVQPVSFFRAVRARAEEGGEDLIAIAFGDSLADAEFFALNLCDAYELRAALDQAFTSQPPTVFR